MIRNHAGIARLIFERVADIAIQPVQRGARSADIEAAADALIGATLYRMLSVTTSVDETIRRYDGLIDTLMSGLSTS